LIEMEEMWMDYSPAAAYRGHAAYIQDYLAAPHEPPPPPPPPHTALTLEFTYLGHAGSNPSAFSFPDTNNRGSELRQRRMINQRASAARSRARKHAYTKELELELEQLRRDNRMLIKRQQDLHVYLLYILFC
jgi:hypothetical protein